MRARLLCCLPLFVLTFASIAAHGQFHEPSKEELAMTSDPKAPGAAAVYLDYEEKTDDPLHYHSVYARIKVLTEKGKELATVNVPYVRGETKINAIHGRTIHPDGTVVPLEGKPEDLLQSKSGDVQIGRRVFTLPSVTVGSILEYAYQIDYDDNTYSSPQWWIQRPYFVHHAQYNFMPFKGFQKGTAAITSHYLVDDKGRVANRLMWTQLLPQGAKMVDDAEGRFSLELTDVPAIPREEHMPPIQSALYRTLFYYTWASSEGDYWTQEAKSWSKDVDHFAEPSGAIKSAVAGIVAPGDSDLVKAQKLYAAVQALDNTDFSREKGKAELKVLGLRQAKRAEDTWAQKSGSKDDITRLYLAMLRAVGIPAYAMKVVNRDEGVFDVTYLNFGQLDDEIVLASFDGKEMGLDPGEKMCPFGTLDWIHADAGGIRQDAKGVGAAFTPESKYADNTTLRTADVYLDAQGQVRAHITYVMAGQKAMGWRQIALIYGKEEMQKRFDRMLQGAMPSGVEAHVDHFLGLDDPGVNLLALVNAEGTLGAATEKRLLLPGFFFEARGSTDFVNEAQRQMPVDMLYPDRIVDKVTYHLPDGVSVEGAPKNDQILWPHRALLVVKMEQQPGQITVTRDFVQGFTAVKAEEYVDLRGFYQKVGASDQQAMVLDVAQGQKGN